MSERTVLDCYKELPEAHAIPDSVWNCYKTRERINELNRLQSEAQSQLYRESSTMLAELRLDWTAEQIDATGMRDCI